MEEAATIGRIEIRPAPKLCINCKHLNGGSCVHPTNMKYSFVDGQMRTHNTVEFLRSTDNRVGGDTLCGSIGRYHERKEAA